MLLVYLRAANFEFPVPFETEYGKRLKKFFKVDNVTESKISNQKFIYFEYENANIFTNFEDIGFTLLHSMSICVLILSSKAIYQMLIYNFNYKEPYLNEGGNDHLSFKLKAVRFVMKNLKN